MPAPRVFVSSTFYDLAPMRENLSRMLRELGLEPVLSEEGAVFYDPQKSAAASAVSDVGHVDLFVLMIGGRYGSEFSETGKSITNSEYEEAIRSGVPVFVLVTAGALRAYEIHRANRDSDSVDSSKIKYPGVDSTKVFDFIEEVTSMRSNNAIGSFDTFSDIQAYLKMQIPSLFQSLLRRSADNREVQGTLHELVGMNQKIEAILQAVNPTEVKQVEERFNAIERARMAVRFIHESRHVDNTLSNPEEWERINGLALDKIVPSKEVTVDLEVNFETLKNLDDMERATAILRAEEEIFDEYQPVHWIDDSRDEYEEEIMAIPKFLDVGAEYLDNDGDVVMIVSHPADAIGDERSFYLRGDWFRETDPSALTSDRAKDALAAAQKVAAGD